MLSLCSLLVIARNFADNQMTANWPAKAVAIFAVTAMMTSSICIWEIVEANSELRIGFEDICLILVAVRNA